MFLPHSSASVARYRFFARPDSGTDPDATGLLQRAPWRDTKMSPQSVVSRPAGCGSVDSAASSYQPCRKRDSVLHCLDVPARKTFKLCLLAYRCLHGSAPPYLIRYFTPVSSIVGSSHLCSAVTAELSTGRMDPRVGSGRVGSGRVGSGRVGSGHDFAGFWRVRSGRVGSALRIFQFFTYSFLVPKSI